MTKRRLVLLVLILSALAPVAAAPAAPLAGVDLSSYVRVGRHDLPFPQASEASSVTYNPDTGTLFVVGDGGTAVVQVSLTGQLIDSMALGRDASNALEFADTEGITYVGGGQFVIAEERLRQVDRFTYVGGGTLHRADVQAVKLGTTLGNIGIEGITDDPVTGGYVAVKELDPESIFQTGIDFAAGTATNGSPSTVNSTNLFDPALAGLADFSDVFALANLSSLSGAQRDDLLIISQASGQVADVTRAGQVRGTLTIHGDADNPLSVPDQTNEGVTMDDDGTLYVVNEQGGGDASHPQLWVYAPSSTPNAAPTGVSLKNAVASLPEDANTTARVKVADVAVADDGLGTNVLALTGPDAAVFEVDTTGLYLKAGTKLDFEAKASYSVTVTVDDPSLGGTPDATSDPYTLNIADIDEGPVTPPSLEVTEVSPWSSGDSSYAADWWEVTNTGAAPVDLTGFKMDDSSSAFGSAVALNGVGTLLPGQSAVFTEGTAATASALTAAWFGTDVPAGFKIGYYSGSGVGLSTSGDGVFLFDAKGNRLTGVSFGASTTGKTFDNAAGADTVTALSVAGRDGARTVGGETGSPGTVLQAPAITEVSPWSSGDSPYAADWFELTNPGTHAIALTGFKIDDNSNAYANAVALKGVDSLAPGESAVFLEGDAATAAAFVKHWFGDTPPAGLKVGYYSGSGVGLSTGGDAVNVYDPFGNRLTGVAFGASTSGKTFDNAAQAGSPTLPLPVVSTLSALGRNGARQAGTEVGSPLTIAPDVKGPVVTFSGNAGTYTVDQAVKITCAAADEAYGSGLASSTCADVNASAASLGLGAHTLTATATDHAGNIGSAQATFTVTATSKAICALTTSYVTASAAYAKLPAISKLLTAALVPVSCRVLLDTITPKAKPLAKAVVVALYRELTAGYARSGLLTSAQAAQLVSFANAL